MASSVIETSSLFHRYSKNWALSDVSIELQGKGIIGLLGSNGAGKSTLMNIVCGCISQTSGSVLVDGIDIQTDPLEARRRIGFLPQQAPLSYELTIAEFIRFSAVLRGVESSNLSKSVDFVIDRCGLGPMRNRLIGNLSGGYRQRVGIAQALVHRPSLIVLDEPTVGLDPNQIFGVRDLIQEIGSDHTVIFSTHILPEVEALCRGVIMIEGGQVVFDGRIDDFRMLASAHSIRVVSNNPLETGQLLSLHSGIHSIESIGANEIRLHTDGDRSIARTIIEEGGKHNWGIEEVCFERPSLEDVFTSLSKGQQR